MFKNQLTYQQIEEYKRNLAKQLEERHKQDINEIKKTVIEELKEYIDEVVKVRNQ